MTAGSCCVESTTASRRPGFPSSLYSTVTWAFPSGRRYGSVPSFLTFASCFVSLCAREIGYGIYSSVSLDAYPNIIPWSPAPIASISSSDILFSFASSALSTPIAISDDCSSIATRTPHVSASNPNFPLVYPISLTVSRTIFWISTYPLVVISPITITRPVVVHVSHATRLIGSCSIKASRIASEIASQTLSG